MGDYYQIVPRRPGLFWLADICNGIYMMFIWYNEKLMDSADHIAITSISKRLCRMFDASTSCAKSRSVLDVLAC